MEGQLAKHRVNAHNPEIVGVFACSTFSATNLRRLADQIVHRFQSGKTEFSLLPPV